MTFRSLKMKIDKTFLVYVDYADAYVGFTELHANNTACFHKTIVP